MIQDPISQTILFVCLDGHGIHGHTVSQFFRNRIAERLFSHPDLLTDIRFAVAESIHFIEKELFTQDLKSSEYSGTTLVLAAMQGSLVTVANIGDSRVILGRKVSSPMLGVAECKGRDNKSTECQFEKIRAIALSKDHKPEIEEESRRIKEMGGRVFPIYYGDGVWDPSRVWLKDCCLPGLAMSRSLGDFVVHTAGVIPTPDIYQIEVDPDNDCFLVIATDGLWDILSNQDVADLTMKHLKPSDAVNNLLEESCKRWLLRGDDTVDDITICVAYFPAFIS